MAPEPVSLADDRTPENVRLLYEKNVAMMTYFLDWRHRVITLWLTATSGLAAVSGWLLDHHRRHAAAAVLSLGALFSLMAILMDLRNEDVLTQHGELAKVLETELGCVGAGPLGSLRGSRPSGWRRWLTYSRIVPGTFGISFAALVGFAAYFWTR